LLAREINQKVDQGQGRAGLSGVEWQLMAAARAGVICLVQMLQAAWPGYLPTVNSRAERKKTKNRRKSNEST
jgi:hypothetical protein